MSYAAWQNLLKSDLWFIGKNTHVPLKQPRKRLSRKYRKFLRAKAKLEDEIVQRRAKTIINKLEVAEPTNHEDVKLELIVMLKQFWERKHILKHIEQTIPARRNKDLITYSKQSIMMCALSIFLFRRGSGYKLSLAIFR